MVSDIFSGHIWNPSEDIGVGLHCAFSYTRHQTSLSHRICHRYWALDYTRDPGGRYLVGSRGASWKSRPAEMAHLYAPGTSYWEDTRALAKPLHGAYILFQGGEQAGLQHLTAAYPHYACIRDTSGQLFSWLHQAAEIGMREGDNGYWQAQAALCQLIYYLQSCRQVEDATWQWDISPPSSPQHTLVASVRAYLAEHLDEPVTLDEIARQVHVSLSTLSHQYRALTGETPLATYQRLRIQQAQHLLRLGMPLTAIAAQLGFYDSAHLSKHFTRIVGISPRAYVNAETTIRK